MTNCHTLNFILNIVLLNWPAFCFASSITQQPLSSQILRRQGIFFAKVWVRWPQFWACNHLLMVCEWLNSFLDVCVTFFVAVVKYPNKSNLRERGLILSLHVSYSSSWWGRHGDRSRSRQPVTLHLPSRSREWWMLVLSWTFPSDVGAQPRERCHPRLG